jgi:hypothetical protein
MHEFCTDLYAVTVHTGMDADTKEVVCKWSPEVMLACTHQ